MSRLNIVITGASSGIGAALARRFSKENCHLVLIARRLEKLEALRQEIGVEKVSIFELDVTNRNDVEKVFSQITKEIGSIDVLVNNAGAAFGLDLAQEADLDDWDKCVDVNIKGLMYCTHSALPEMVKRNKGYVVNIGSVAGEYPYPKGNVYGASKAFVQMFSKNLRADLFGTAVRITCIEPGLTTGTEFSKVRYKGDEARASKVYEGTQPLQAEDIAEVIHYCISSPPHVNINSLEVMPVLQSFGTFTVHRT